MALAKIVEDSVNSQGVRLTTFQLRYQRFIHAELMTHRVFSRNASSSRAIPVKKMIQQVWNDPAMPVYWGANQAGMQAKQELTGWKLGMAKFLWRTAAKVACGLAYGMVSIGMHKQIANRLLEPWQFIHVVLTATEFDNWSDLRIHPDAQPEIFALARAMHELRIYHRPTKLHYGEWHLPYVTENERDMYGADALRKVSAARCCRVSYLKHDGTMASIDEDIALCNRLAGAKPIHASPFEHQATPDMWHKEAKFGGSDGYDRPWQHGNFVGWIQNRKLLEESL